MLKIIVISVAVMVILGLLTITLYVTPLRAWFNTCPPWFRTPLAAFVRFFRMAWFDTCPAWFRIPVLGFGRFFCMFTGLKGTSIHNAASLYILFAGFVVEVVVLWHFLLDKSQPVAAPHSEAEAMNRSIIFLLLLPLFAHQFLIFRNFTLPHSDASMGLPPPSVENKSDKNDEFIPSSWQARLAVGAFTTVRFVRGTIEFFIYLAFGIISGEAGYLYAVGSVNNSQSPLFEWIRDNVVQTTSLQEALEGLFVAGALTVCLLVFLWDCFVGVTMCFPRKGAKVREQYKRVILWFFFLDMFSMAVWLLIASFGFHWFSQFSDYSKFQVLFAIALLYLMINVTRLCFGIWRLGKASSFDEAKALAI